MAPVSPIRVPSNAGSLSPANKGVCRQRGSAELIIQGALLFLLLFASQLTSESSAIAQVPAKRVLIVTGYDPSHPSVTTILRNITSTIRNGSNGRVEFFYEIQENLRIPNAKYESEMVSYLKRKYDAENITLVLALGAPALQFLLDHEANLFPGIPKVFYFYDQTEQTALNLWPRVTGVWANLELDKTLDLALRLHPNTQNVMVVSGNSKQDKFLREEAQAAFSKYEARLHFTYLNDVTIEQLKTTVTSLPPNSVVIYLSFFVDKNGNSYSGPEALSMFASASSAPIYGISQTYMGSGIVGGHLMNFETLGNATGELCLRLMAGEKAENIPPQTVPTVVRFDWRQLRRWNIDRERLPANAIIEFETPTFWALYKWYVVIAIAVILIQAFLILRLLISQARRREADISSRRLAALAQSEHKRLDEVISNVPGIVWETRIDPNTGARRTTFISEHVEKMLGYTVEEWLSRPSFGITLVAEEDRERVNRESEDIVASRRARVIQFRWIAKDGRVLWVEAHLAPILDEAGKTVGVRGVTLDVTEQQQAQDAQRQSEERNRALLEAIPDQMFLQTLDGTYLDYHATELHHLPVPPEGFLGKKMHDVLPSDVADAFLRRFRQAEQGEPQILEYELDVNGNHRWFEARIVRTGDNVLSVVRNVTSRKLVEIALTQNEAQLAGIIGSALDGIITVDDQQKVVLFNAAAEKLFQCSATEALGHPIDRFIPQRFREAHREHIYLFGEQEVTRRIMSLGDLCGLRNNGEEFPIEASISQIDVSGQKFYTVILRDVTERKRAEDELRHSEERFAKAFRSNPQPMSLTIMETGRYLDVNEAFLTMSGYSREEVIGQTSLELGIWERPDVRADFVRQLNELGSIVNLETKFYIKDGSQRVLLSSAEKLEIDKQQCVLVASSDITERVAAQQALRESEERFRHMADSAPMMIWVSGEDKQCTYVNKRWLDFTGRTFEEEIGDGWSHSVHADDYDHCLTTYISSFDNRQSLEMEYRLRRHDGEYRWFLDTATPRFASDGSFLGYIGTCLDITERKESEVALQKAHRELNELKNHLEAENIYLHDELRLDQTFDEIVGHSDAIKYVLFTVAQVAPTDSTVLITGETGTGKELVARAVHSASLRKERPLIKVNCGALSPTLIESELFGHEKGAFTGAGARKLGRFELANGGTIFLDEIAELSNDLQAKLLRVIQENEFERLGGTKTIKVDVRIIAATNRNLKLDIEEGKFREDLWYRLNVYPITVPPLRQRKEDIPLLVHHFMDKHARKFGKQIHSVSPSAMHALQGHWWPGNVRELANVVERAVINTRGTVLQLVDSFEEPVAELASSTKTLEEIERDYIIRTLENTGWRIEGLYGAAKVLGMNPSTLRTRMLKLGIQRRGFKYA